MKSKKVLFIAVRISFISDMCPFQSKPDNAGKMVSLV